MIAITTKSSIRVNHRRRPGSVRGDETSRVMEASRRQWTNENNPRPRGRDGRAQRLRRYGGNQLLQRGAAGGWNGGFTPIAVNRWLGLIPASAHRRSIDVPSGGTVVSINGECTPHSAGEQLKIERVCAGCSGISRFSGRVS